MPASSTPQALLLPRPGPRWGSYPQRPSETPSMQAPSLLAGQLPRLTGLPAAWVLKRHRHWLARVHAHREALARSPEWTSNAPRDTLTQRIKQRLRGEGLHADSLAEALALVSLVVHDTMGRQLHDTQLLASAMLLDQCAVELATGEGKTLSMAAAACVAALAGVPTHVVTANDYLAARDAGAMAPLWSALSLRTGHISPTHQAAQRRSIYGCDIVYATAKELAFDHLRDALAQSGTGHETPVMRGLSLALLDEADSILLDEAVVPLRISSSMNEPPARQAQRRAVWWQAWQLAGHLHAHVHTQPSPMPPQMLLTDAGRAELARRVAALPGLWQRSAWRDELVQMALTAAHGLHRDQHYLVRDGEIVLLDTLTGRVAQGRVWSQGLQALIELKEGCQPSPPTDTLAQLTFQRFFQRYWRLGGLSGTLKEARGELRSVYGLHVLCLPSRQPSRRVTLPVRLFATPDERWAAIADRIKAWRSDATLAARPILIGTDSVADSERLSWHLHRAGIAHALLNARHDEAEAAILAQAGQAGAVTVSTRMAGRGTDIALDEWALAAGGLHVIDCQRNESRRMDRQLWGRCARQGQPGSTETWLCTGLSVKRKTVDAPKLPQWTHAVILTLDRCVPAWRQGLWRLSQWLQTRRQVAMRRQLMEQDRQWDKHHQWARQQAGPR